MIDSGCTNHMTGDKKMFKSFEPSHNKDEYITFGDNGMGQVLDYGKVPLTPSYSLSKVMLVDHVDFNLLSISQFCKMGYDCLFNECGATVYKRSDGSIAFKGVLKGKLYVVDFSTDEARLGTCLLAKSNMGWL